MNKVIIEAESLLPNQWFMKLTGGYGGRERVVEGSFDDLLAALGDAYRELVPPAASKPTALSPVPVERPPPAPRITRRPRRIEAA